MELVKGEAAYAAGYEAGKISKISSYTDQQTFN